MDRTKRTVFKEFSAQITHVEEHVPSRHLSIWYRRDQKTVGYILDHCEKYKHYFNDGNGQLSSKEIRPGTVYYAKYVETWYRVKIIEGDFAKSDDVAVFFIDFGNSEMISVHNLRQLEDNGALDIADQATQCLLGGVVPVGAEWSKEALDYAEGKLIGKDAIIRPWSTFSNGLQLVSLQLCNDKSTFSEQLLDLRMAVKIPVDPITTQPCSNLTSQKGSPRAPVLHEIKKVYNNPPVMKGVHEVYISYVVSPRMFFVLLKGDYKTHWNVMHSDLARWYHRVTHDKWKNSKAPIAVSQACVARNTWAGLPCRGLIYEMAGDDMCGVYFLDVGNSEKKRKSEVVHLPESALHTPVLARKCQLYNPEMDSGAATVLSKLHQEHLLAKCNFLTCNKGIYQVDIQVASDSRGRTVPGSVAMVPLKLCYKELKLELMKLIVGDVVLVNKDCNVNVRLWDYEKQFVEMQNKLQVACRGRSNELSAEQCEPGTPCCVLSEEDNLWYRGEIHCLIETASVVRLSFVDTGHVVSITTHRLACITPEFLSLPRLAVQCCLDGIDKNKASDEEYRWVLQSLLLGKRLFLKAIKNQDSVHSIVLINDETVEINKIVNKRLREMNVTVPLPKLRKTELIYVTHFESSDDFFGQLMTVPVDELDCLNEKLNEYYGKYGSDQECAILTKDVDRFCCAKYDKDRRYYRAKISSVDAPLATVKFVDYGNVQEIPLDCLMRLKEEFAEVPQVGIFCRCEASLGEVPLVVLKGILLDQKVEVEIVESLKDDVQVVRLARSKVNEQLWTTLFEYGVYSSVAAAVASPKETGRTFCLPVLGDVMDIFITYFESPKKFWFTSSAHADELDALSYAIEKYVNSEMRTELPLRELKAQAICLAKASGDMTYYRAVIEEQVKEEVRVKFVDYGNSERLKRTELLHLPDNLARYPVFAVEGALPNLCYTEFSDEAIFEMENFFLDKQFLVQVHKSAGSSVFKLDFLDDLGKLGLEKFNLQRKPGNEPPRNRQVQSPSVSPHKDDGAETLRNGYVGHSVQKASSNTWDSASQEEDRSGRFSGSHDGRNRSESGRSGGSGGHSRAEQGEWRPNSNESGYRHRENRDESGSWRSENRQNSNGAYPRFVPPRMQRLLEQNRESRPQQPFEDFDNRRKKSGEDWNPPTTHSYKEREERNGWPGERTENRAEEGRGRDDWRSGGSRNDDDDKGEEDGWGSEKDGRRSHHYANDDRGRSQSSQGGGWRRSSEDQEGRSSRSDNWRSFNGTSGDRNDDRYRDRYGGRTRRPTELEGITVGNALWKSVSVVHLVTPSEFYCHLMDYASEFDTMTESLRQADGGRGQHIRHAKAGMVCCVRYSLDEQWYRAKVISAADNQVEVEFVDFGNRELADSSQIKFLDYGFWKLPMQAVRCRLHDCLPVGDTWKDASLEPFKLAFLDKHMIAQFRNRENDGTYVIKLVNPKQVVNIRADDQLLRAGILRPMNTNEIMYKRDVLEDLKSPFEALSIAGGSVESIVVVSDVGTDGFCCQLTKSQEDLQRLSESLNGEYKNCKGQERCCADLGRHKPCVCPFTDPEGQEWYRGCILTADDSKVLVYLVDYARIETIAKDDVKEIKPEFMELPMQALYCRLRGLASKRLTCSSHIPETLLDGELQCTFDSFLENHFLVDVQSNGKDVAQEVIVMNEAQTSLMQLPTTSAPAGATIDAAPDASIRESSQISATPGPASSSIPRFSAAFGSEEDVYLTKITAPNKFWIQRVSCEAEIAELVTKLNELCENSSPDPSAKWEVGSLCLAQYSEDYSWYRSVVEDVSDGDTVLVYFVDYGNSEVVSCEKIRSLPAEFRDIPVYSVECSLSGMATSVNEFSEDVLAAFQELLLHGEEVVRVKYQTSCGQKYFVTLTARDQDVGKALCERCGLELVTEAETDATIKDFSVKLNQPVNVLLSSIQSPSQFFAQKLEDRAKLDSLQNDLNAEYLDSSADSTEVWEEGVFCVARFPEDNSWYRAKVLLKTWKGFCVYFVDYGNQDVVPSTDLRRIRDRFAELPVLAAQCTIYANEPLPDDAATTEAFNDLVNYGEKELVAKFTQEISSGSDGKKFIVELFDGDKDLLQQLCAIFRPSPEVGGLPEKQYPNFQPTFGIVTKVAGCRSSAPNDFWLQRADDQLAIKQLAVTLSVMYGVDAVDVDVTNQHQFSVGSACVAFWKNIWRRATIVELHDDTAVLRFVDYGKIESVERSSLRAAKKEILGIPCYAAWCTLKGIQPNREHEWSQQLMELFTDLTRDDERDLRATFLKQRVDDRFIVELCFDGNCVAAVLISAGAERMPDIEEGTVYREREIEMNMKHKVFVSHAETPSQFWLQLASTETQLLELQEDLHEKYSKTSEPPACVRMPVGSICAAKYSVDSSWYRGEVLEVMEEEATVHFVDYGNKEPVLWTDLRELSPELALWPIFAVQGKLSGIKLPEDGWSEDAISKFLGLAGIGVTGLVADFVARTDCYVVRLLDMGIDIGSAMVIAGVVEKENVAEEADDAAAEAEPESAVVDEVKTVESELGPEAGSANAEEGLEDQKTGQPEDSSDVEDGLEYVDNESSSSSEMDELKTTQSELSPEVGRANADELDVQSEDSKELQPHLLPLPGDDNDGLEDVDDESSSSNEIDEAKTTESELSPEVGSADAEKLNVQSEDSKEVQPHLIPLPDDDDEGLVDIDDESRNSDHENSDDSGAGTWSATVDLNVTGEAEDHEDYINGAVKCLGFKVYDDDQLEQSARHGRGECSTLMVPDFDNSKAAFEEVSRDPSEKGDEVCDGDSSNAEGQECEDIEDIPVAQSTSLESPALQEENALLIVDHGETIEEKSAVAQTGSEDSEICVESKLMVPDVDSNSVAAFEVVSHDPSEERDEVCDGDVEGDGQECEEIEDIPVLQEENALITVDQGETNEEKLTRSEDSQIFEESSTTVLKADEPEIEAAGPRSDPEDGDNLESSSDETIIADESQDSIEEPILLSRDHGQPKADETANDEVHPEITQPGGGVISMSSPDDQEIVEDTIKESSSKGSTDEKSHAEDFSADTVAVKVLNEAPAEGKKPSGLDKVENDGPVEKGDGEDVRATK